MKRQSPRDRAFMEVFAKKLREARKTAKEKDHISYEEFAGKLGVTRAGLLKYLNEENMPSLEIIERARTLGVEVQYGDLGADLIKKRAKRDQNSPEAQMLLPLALDNLTDQNVTVEIARKKENAVELNVTISFGSKRQLA